MPNMGGLQLSELLSQHHRRQAEPNYNTVTPDAGMPGALGPADPKRPHNLIAPDVAAGLLDFLPDNTTDALGPVLWNMEEHLRNVSERIGKWPVSDWHAIDRVILSNTVNVDGYQLKGNPVFVAGRSPTRRLTVWNPTGLAVDLTDAPGSGALITCPAGMCLVLPWNADSVLVSTASPIVADSTVLLVRSDREVDEIRAFPINPAATLLDNTTGIPEVQRTPDTFKTATLALGAGAHTVWTPAVGKRFRLMGYDLTVSNDAILGVAGDATFNLQETGGIILHRDVQSLPAAASTVPGSLRLTWVPGGNGYLSVAHDNVLSVSFGTALTGGTVVANAWGTEE